jgi:FKBP-type peptidyl-prolyl cis-trans isomerase
MHKITRISLSALLSLCLSHSVYAEMTTELQKQSYALGAGFGMQMKSQQIEVDIDKFIQAFRDAYHGNDLAFGEDELKAHSKAFQTRMMAQARVKAEAAGSENKVAGEAFLAKNKTRDGVVTTDSGLQYEILKAGEGAKPTAADKVKVHYTGTLIDGTVFDSSVERGEPISFKLSNVIKGWTEGLQLMNVGAKYKFFIPSDIAYGERQQGQTIGPNSTLIFEVELLGINE